MKQLAIEKIRLDGGTQPRESLDGETIATYVEAWQSNAEFPPITVFFDGTDYWCADGFHRTESAKAARVEKIRADIRQGSQRDAILFSAGANDKHGKPRTNADKRRSVTRLLTDDEWGKRSDRWIAEKCAVHNSFVSRMRAELSPSDSSQPRTGKDGKTRKQKIGSAGEKRPRSEAASTEPETWRCDRCKAEMPASTKECLTCWPREGTTPAPPEDVGDDSTPDEEELVLRARGEVDEVVRRHYKALPPHRMRDLWMMLSKWERLFAEKVQEHERRDEEEDHGSASANDAAGALRAASVDETHARRTAGQRR